jgi:histidinol-phosphate aminotransferase
MMTVREPNQTFLEQFLTPSIFTARGYHLEEIDVEVKLDQNESPWDWPDSVKDAVLAKLKERPWNRYPSPFADDLSAKIAKKLGVETKNILLGPGSNYLIGLVLQTFSKKIKGRVIIPRPSFPLYESHCQYEGIPYDVWPLNDDLEYDLKLMPKLDPGSMVIFASPNNPVGNVLSRSVLKGLLTDYPDVLFVGDEAYCEFAEEPYTDLLKDYSNLILVRTFSKTLGAAGVRLGYILGAANVVEILRKPRVPFLLNQFTIVAATEVMENTSMAKIFDEIVQNAIRERKRVHAALEKESGRLHFVVKPSQANFLLLRWPTSEQSDFAYKHILGAGILVRNVSKAPSLQGCLRISIGTGPQNDRLIQAFLAMRPS